VEKSVFQNGTLIKSGRAALGKIRHTKPIVVVLLGGLEKGKTGRGSSWSRNKQASAEGTRSVSFLMKEVKYKVGRGSTASTSKLACSF